MDKITRSILLLVFVVLAACGEFIREDKDFSDNRRSVDIESDNAESLVWTAYMAGVEAFRQSNLHVGLTPQVFGAQSGTYTCAGGGEIAYGFSKNSGERLVSGDTFDLQYTDCINANGERANGRVHGSFSSVEGYNSGVLPTLDVDECIARVVNDDAPNALLFENSTDQVVFELQTNTLQIIFRDLSASNGHVDVAIHPIGLNDTAIVLNRSQTDPSSSRAIDKTQLFLVENQEAEAIDCDEARLEGTMNVSDLIVEGDEITSTLNTSLTLDYWYRSASNEDFEFSADSADITITKNNYTESVTINGLEWASEIDQVVNNGYSLEVSGEMTGDAVAGYTEIEVPSTLRGGLNDALPKTGQLRVLGVGLERSTMNIDDMIFVRFAVAPEGDVSGNLQPDSAPVFSNSWIDFLNREFLRPELVVTTL